MEEKKIYLIAAMSDNRVIGIENRLPWHFSVDLKKFKQMTTGNTVVMGRHTFESMGHKPLPNRENIVLTQFPQETQESSDLKFSSSLQEAVERSTNEKIFIIGGQSVYERAIHDLPISGIYLSKIYQLVPGDAYFPEIPPSFKQTSSEILQENPKIEFIYLENQTIATKR